MVLNNFESKGINSLLLGRLLLQLHCPRDRTGLRHALPNCLSSIRSISVLIAPLRELSDLLDLLEQATNNLDLFHNSPVVRDANSMAGRYQVHPVYSLYTQGATATEPVQFSTTFQVLTGLLLAEIWLSEHPWNLIPTGYENFILKLRIVRKDCKWGDLPPFNSESETLEQFLGRSGNKFIDKGREMFARIQSLTATSPTPTPLSLLELVPPVTPIPASPTTGTVVVDTDHRSQILLGDHDEWKVGKRVYRRPVVTGRPIVPDANIYEIQKTPVSKSGVDTAELTIEASVFEAPATPIDQELPELNVQKALVLEASFSSEMDNQFLPFTWENLNKYEADTLVDAIKATLIDASASTDMKIGALLTGLSLCVGRGPDDLAAMRFVRNGIAKPAKRPTLYLEQSCWFSTFPPLDRFTPSSEQSVWLKHVGEGCFLSLPTELLAGLQELTKDAVMLGAALSRSPEKVVNLTAEFCSKVRQDARTRANVPWLRRVIFNRLFTLSQDEVGSSATLGKTEFSQTTGLYYATFEQGKWQEHYNKALSSLGFTPSQILTKQALPYGSRQYPLEEKLRHWIEEYRRKTIDLSAKARSLEEIIEAHNSYAFYTFIMLLTNSGHRPAALYSFGLESLDFENGWGLISDKITSPSTRVRLFPLSEVVVEQLRHYVKHLRNLSSRLSQHDTSLSVTISMLMDDPGKALIPFFFTLENDLKIKAIDSNSLAAWPYERNALRHFLSTGLRDLEISSEYIANLLGHVGNGQLGFGRFSALSPAAWKVAMVPALNDFMCTMGWVSIAGLTHTRQPTPDQQAVREILLKIPEIDLFAKARKHVQSSNDDAGVVKSAFLEAKKMTPPETPRDDFIAAFKEEIIKRSAEVPDRLAIRLNIHVRYVRLYRHALRPSSIPGWAADMHVEDTPLEPETLALASSAKKWRAALLEILENFSDRNFHERLAIVMISGVLFGCLLRKDLIDQLPERIAHGVRKFKDDVWIDFVDAQSGSIHRWLPDDVTVMLIGQFRLMSDFSQTVHSDHLTRGLKTVMQEIKAGASANNDKKLFDELIYRAKAFFSLQLPGLLSAYANGEVRSASLSESAYLRLLSGLPIIPPPLPEPPERSTIRPHPRLSQEAQAGKIVKEEIFIAIRNEFPPSASGATQLKGERKNRLSSLSKSLSKIAEAHPEIPSIAFALLSWTDHLANEGSVIVKEPTPSTIYSYVSDISTPLTLFAGDVDFIELSEAELSDLYLRVIDHGSVKNRMSRATSLRYFHEFCVEEFDLEDIDWDEVAPGYTSGTSRVSANLVTHTEYLLAKDMIENHPALTLRERQMNKLALVLLYRCGLRLGELLRLTVSDVILGTQKILLVRNGIYGKTKTRAGVRQVPWLDRLQEDELNLLKMWIDHRRTIVKKDPWGALFGTDAESRVLEMRINLSRTLTHVLRHVTGDNSIRIHHLRHGVATAALSLALGDSSTHAATQNAAMLFNFTSYDPASEFRLFHLGNASCTRRINYAIAQAIGHTSPRTTCWHYGHSLDVMLHEYVGRSIVLKNVQIAKISGIKQNLLNVTAFKNPDVAPALLAQRWMFKSIQGLDSTITLADHPADASNLPSPQPIRPIYSPLLAHRLLVDIANNFPRVQIAKRHAREEIEITKIEKAALKLERSTGYTQYHLANRGKATPVILSNIEFRTVEKLFTGHAREIWPRLKDVLSDPRKVRALEDGLEVWSEYFQKSHKGLRVTYTDDLEKFLAILELIGIDRNQIILTSKEWDTDDKEHSSKKYKIPAQNLLNRSAKYPSRRWSSSGLVRTPSLFVAHGAHKNEKLSSDSMRGAAIQMQKLHGLFFLSLVLLRYRTTIIQ